jgi:hypothetical protein
MLMTQTGFTGPEVSDAAELLQRISDAGGTARALGGIAVAMRCHLARNGAPLTRAYGDLDIATDRGSIKSVTGVLEAAGYQPSRHFNAAHGRRRLLFIDESGKQVDVFIETFAMCHVLPLKHRLKIHPVTLSLADLLLTKLQIARLNRKDVLDAVALLADHDITTTEDGINGTYVAEVLSSDWGWWRTVGENIATVDALAPRLGLAPSDLNRIASNSRQLGDLVAHHRKSARWRMRARLGDRVPWRDEPEELEHK